MAYILFAYMYALTVFYGIWHLVFVEDESEKSYLWPILSTFLYTVFFSLMLVSHMMAMMVDPGTVPKEYDRLYEIDLPFQFYDLIKERESIYAEHIVRKKLRKNQIP